jgi:hypothetical protein
MGSKFGKAGHSSVLGSDSSMLMDLAHNLVLFKVKIAIAKLDTVFKSQWVYKVVLTPARPPARYTR